MRGRWIPSTCREEEPVARRIPAAGSVRRGPWRRRRRLGEVWGRGCVGSCGSTPHPDPLCRSQQTAQTGVSGLSHRSLWSWPEIPVLGAETSVRPESPAWKTGVSGPTDSKTHIYVFGHAKCKRSKFLDEIGLG